MDLPELEKKIKVKFKNIDLLQSALTHRSYINEHRSYELPHNERLEFLGDAVLELITTEHLYRTLDNPEGELTNIRSALVNTRTLSKIAQHLELEDHLIMSRGEAKDLGRARQVILANATEAVIGAIYLDGGMKTAKKFIEDFVLSELQGVLDNKTYIDPKSHLQELVQEKLSITPIYHVISESGPDHAKQFIMGVYAGEKSLGQGDGPSKQDAEVAAAEDALEKRSF